MAGGRFPVRAIRPLGTGNRQPATRRHPAHLLLFDQYVATHAKEAAMMRSMPMAPKVMMLITGPIVGVISGLVLGLFAWIASKLVTKYAVQKPGTA